MMKSAKEIVESAKRLPLSERAAVIEALLDSMDTPDPAIDARWVTEAESRLQAYETGELKTIDADEVMSNLRK